MNDLNGLSFYTTDFGHLWNVHIKFQQNTNVFVNKEAIIPVHDFFFINYASSKFRNKKTRLATRTSLLVSLLLTWKSYSPLGNNVSQFSSYCIE